MAGGAAILRTPIGTSRAGAVDWALHVLAWLLLGLAFYQTYVVLGLLMAAPQHDLWSFFSSDTLVFAALYQDLFVDGYAWSGWHVSNAPQYLQMGLFFLLRAATGSFAWTHFLLALLQPLLLMAGFALLTSTLAPRRGITRHTLVVLAGALLVLLFNSGRAHELIGVFWVCRHAGVIIVSIFALALLLRIAGEPRLWQWVALGALCLLAGLSDPLFAPAFVAPAAIALAALALLRQITWRRSGAAMATTLGATLVGLLIGRLVSSHSAGGRHVALQLGDVGRSAGRFSGELLAQLDQRVAVSVALVLFAALNVGYICVTLATRNRSRPLPVAWLGFAVFGLGAVASVASAIVVTGNTAHQGWVRYLAPVTALSLFGVALYLGAALSVLAPMARRAALVLLLAALQIPMLLSWRHLPADAPPVVTAYPALTRCLDQQAALRDLHYGVAPYWLAKYNTMFSRSGLRIYQVKLNLKPFYAANNIDWYLGRPDAAAHAEPRYSFVVLGGRHPHKQLTRETVEGHLGPAQTSFRCQAFEVLVYGPEMDARLKQVFLTSPELQHRLAQRSGEAR